MKLFYLTPKQFFEAVIIGLVLSLTFAVLLTTPIQVESPPVKITPVPTQPYETYTSEDLDQTVIDLNQSVIDLIGVGRLLGMFIIGILGMTAVLGMAAGIRFR